jgi:hypothetical protein
LKSQSAVSSSPTAADSPCYNGLCCAEKHLELNISIHFSYRYET